MELDSGFAYRIKWAISTKNSNQSELARHLGVSPQGVQQWVSGATQNPKRDHLKQAADFLNVRYEWLAYGRGPMRKPDGEHTPAPAATGAETEVVLLAHEWETALETALPDGERAHWQHKFPHPSGKAMLRVSWASDTLVAEVGLYRATNTLVYSARQLLWLLVVAREALPPVPGRRVVLLLAPLEPWRDTPEAHIDALRAEARTVGIEVLVAAGPEHAAAILTGQEQAPLVPNGLDLGLEAPLVL